MFKRFLRDAWSQVMYPIIWGLLANWVITITLMAIIVLLIVIF